MAEIPASTNSPAIAPAILTQPATISKAKGQTAKFHCLVQHLGKTSDQTSDQTSEQIKIFQTAGTLSGGEDSTSWPQATLSSWPTRGSALRSIKE